MTTHEDPRLRDLDDLRRQLRSLGYLDAGVDRFVLGSAQSSRPPTLIALLASVRIGVIAALLLGPAAAVGVAARFNGLITGARDGFVVAAYLGVLFGTAAFAAAVVLTLAAVALSARLGHTGTRRLALAGGALFTMASLGYLTLWWDASTLTSGATTWRSAATVMPLALAAAISLLLGHLVTVTTLAVMVARSGTSRHVQGVPGTSRRVLAGAAALTFAGAVLLFNFTARRERAAPEAPPLTVVSSGVRVRLIGIDGFDPQIARRMAATGKLPAFAALLQGAIARLDAGDTSDPARGWTTIATAQPPHVHAVHALETRRVAGVQGTFASGGRSALSRAIDTATDLLRLTRPSIASGSERRVRTLWEVASAAGLRTVVVNWWATWPAPADSGTVITDRAAVRLERGGDLDAEIAPPEVYDALRSRWSALRAEAAAPAAALQAETATAALLKRSLELDGLQLATTRAVMTSATDLACTYLNGLDVVQHALFAASDAPRPGASAMADKLAALEDYYLALDRLLEPHLHPAAGEMVVVVTSPGRIRNDSGGLLAAAGTPVNSRLKDGVARATDVMPTVLHALGVPVSRELAGRPLVEMFSAEFARRSPVREVATYGPPRQRQGPRQGQPLDQEMIDRLRSLGYVK